MQIHVAFTPCPNDTTLFYAWEHKLIANSLTLAPEMADIETLNQWALSQQHPVTKVSFGCFDKVIENYVLLPVGITLGYNCGPILIAKKSFNLEQISEKKVAIPGINTTAHLLFNRLIEKQPAQKIFCRYDEIFALLRDNVVDCGVIIHESRFTYKNAGFSHICDLGLMWHNKYQLPIPLAGYAIRRDLIHVSDIISCMQQSFEYAFAHSDKTLHYVLKHSQEKDLAIVKMHINLYVTQEILALTPLGRQAIETLLAKEHNQWLFS